MTNIPKNPNVCRNAERASDAEKALGFYFHVKNAKVLPFDPDSEGQETLVDLLADLRHWASQNDVDFNAAERMAATHFECELDEETAEAAKEGGEA